MTLSWCTLYCECSGKCLLRQRRRLILRLDEQDGKRLWRKNLMVFCKEKISRILKK